MLCLTNVPLKKKMCIDCAHKGKTNNKQMGKFLPTNGKIA